MIENDPYCRGAVAASSLANHIDLLPQDQVFRLQQLLSP